MFTLCVSDLVQDSREFDLILGRLEVDGCRTPGLIDLFKGLKQSTTDIIRYVAGDCERKGNLEDSINLFDLANVSIVLLTVSVIFSVLLENGSCRKLSLYSLAA